MAHKNGVTDHLISKVRRKIVSEHVRELKQKAAVKGEYVNPRNVESYQESVVQVSYIRNEKDGQWKAHGQYLSREASSRRRGRNLGFNQRQNDLNIAKTVSTWERAGDELLFKVMVSPDEGHRLNLSTHARQLMIGVQKDLCTKLEWVAVCHENTCKPHIHILIRGMDEQEKVLRIAKYYIKDGFRHRSQEAASQTLGFKLQTHALNRRKTAVNEKRITNFDRDIVANLDANNQISFANPERNPVEQSQLRRLLFLEAHGFAKKIGTQTWQIVDCLLHSLKCYQISRDIIKRRSQNLDKISDPRLPFVYSKLNPGERVVGRIVSFGPQKADSAKGYILMEGLDSKVHYIPVPVQMLRKGAAVKISNDDIVSIVADLVFDQKCQQKMCSLVVENWGTLRKIREVGSSGADRYIFDRQQQNKSFLRDRCIDRTFVGEFNKWMAERLQSLEYQLKPAASEFGLATGRQDGA